MELFTTDEKVGQGLPLFMPKGAKLFQTLQRWIEDEEEKRGYVLTKTPFMAKSDLYKVSGHWDHYKDGMFVLGDEEKDDRSYGIKTNDLSIPIHCLQCRPTQLQRSSNKIC